MKFTMIKQWTSMLYTFKVLFIPVKQKSTIFALSSGMVKSGIAVFRISGANSEQVLRTMTNIKTLPKPRFANLKNVYDPDTNEPLDKGMILWFPAPNSFTGEDMCELQVHGSKAVIQAVTSALLKVPDVRPAEPGEFTKRAFYAGKFGLTEVEGLADLIDSETELQRKQALYQMEGSLEKIYANWRQTILENLASVEAFIDFSEEENVDLDVLSVVKNNIQRLISSIQAHLSDFRKGEILRDGIKTVIAGSPNVGKSSLLNILCRRPAAIVTEIAGTTRDVIQTTLNINGYPVVLSDTAGIRDTDLDDVIEIEGIRRSINEILESNLIIIVLDIKHVLDSFKNTSTELLSTMIRSYCENYKKKLGIDTVLPGKEHIIVANKKDLLTSSEKTELESIALSNFITVSCETEDGISDMLEQMSMNFQQLCGIPDENNPLCSRSRHRYHLSECTWYLNEFMKVMKSGSPEENVVFAAENLRVAASHLGSITGIIAADEVLAIIFKQFCIGK